MKWFVVAALAVCVLVPSAHCADNSGWCYHNASCGYETWPTIAAPYCNGTRQSPININTSDVTYNANLTAFTFTNYDNTSVMKKIENTGKTVKVILDSGVQISGGGLSEAYDSLQFHLHWGNRTSVPGSEHTVNGKQYPMELHIVNAKSSYKGNTSLAIKDPEGLAALGFFIEEMSGSSTGMPISWKNLSDLLTSIQFAGQSANINLKISLDDLLKGVDRTKYWRYLGSLTTPACNEAVVWTVFKDTIKVSKDVIDLFSTKLHIGSDNSSALMVNVYRGIQAKQPVSTQPMSSSSASTACYSVGLLVLSLALGWR